MRNRILHRALAVVLASALATMSCPLQAWAMAAKTMGPGNRPPAASSPSAPAARPPLFSPAKTGPRNLPASAVPASQPEEPASLSAEQEPALGVPSPAIVQLKSAGLAEPADSASAMDGVFDNNRRRREADRGGAFEAVGAAGRAPVLAPAGSRGTGGIRKSAPPATPSRRAGRLLTLSSWAFRVLAFSSMASTGLVWGALGLSPLIGAALPFGLALAYGAFQRMLAPAGLALEEEEIERSGAVRLNAASAPELMGRIARLAEQARVPMPKVYAMPDSWRDGLAETVTIVGTKDSLLLLSQDALAHEELDSVLAHEIQHAADKSRVSMKWPHVTLAAMALGAAIHAPLTLLALPPALAALAMSAFYELRADLSAVQMTGGDGILKVLAAAQGTAWRTWLLRFLKLFGESRSFLPPPDQARVAAENEKDKKDKEPAYYQDASSWAAKLQLEPSEAFADPAENAAYERELARLRPLARWMAHFYAKLKEKNIQRPPNILTIQDLLNWADYVRKFDAMGWRLVNDKIEVEDGQGGVEEQIVEGAVKDGARTMLQKTLPTEHEGRKLRQEFEGLFNQYAPILDQLALPERLPRFARKETAEAAEEGVKFFNEEPSLFEAKDLGSRKLPDYVFTKTVNERRDDLLTLYSFDYREKFFPLLMGDSGEGKSSLVEFVFEHEQIKDLLGGRVVPVVSIPVKESMTRRELLGGKGSNGIELGFFSLAVQHGWALVLEELNQAAGEFKKLLNDALHQIRKHGYFEFEVGGQTVRVHAHPHVFIVGTQNFDEGNFALTRNPDSPDFLKRWVVRPYSPLPAIEQAEIMRGLVLAWHGEGFAERHHMSQEFFERVVTLFHNPVRTMAASGVLGGDLQEPYEYNRRTLHRFLRRFTHDLASLEAQGKAVDEKLRYTLLARELMEAYGAELKRQSEKDALWDKMNTAFDLQGKRGILKEDLEIEVRGFYRKDGRLIIDEKLVPVSLPLRENGGRRVPGPEHRLTMIPSLARLVYRSLRSRQFGDHEFSTGPTGTAKTSKQFFITHMLGEPLFSMTLDDQTPMSEFHGSFMRGENWEPKFHPGILSRAMMYDPRGLLKSGGMTAQEVGQSPHIGATLLINEGNASTVIETINPALDKGVMPLSDGRHAAVAGAGFHVDVTYNPAGEGYAGYPMTGALKSRGQIMEHPGDVDEAELAEVILDRLTGLTRHLIK